MDIGKNFAVIVVYNYHLNNLVLYCETSSDDYRAFTLPRSQNLRVKDLVSLDDHHLIFLFFGNKASVIKGLDVKAKLCGG